MNNEDFARLMPAVALKLLGEPKTETETEWRYGTKGSLNVNLAKGTWHSFEPGGGSGGVLDLIMKKTGCSRQDAVRWLKVERIMPRPTGNQTTAPNDEDKRWEEDQRWRRALDILQTAHEAKAGKPTAYLRGRGITIVPESAMLLPSEATHAVNKFPHRGFPAMVFAVASMVPALPAAHVTFLDRSGKSKLNVDNAKRAYGPIRGGYIWLGGFDPERVADKLIIAEGVETALSARQISGIPAIAALSAGNMQVVNPPPAKEYILCADNDKAGRDAAEALAQRLVGRGSSVRIAVAPGPEHADFNDALRECGSDEDKLAALRDGILQAEPPSRTDFARYALSMQQILDLEVPPQQYLLEPWLETGSTAMIFGRRGSFKTRFAMSVGYAIATDASELLGWKVHKTARVLYIDGELPAALLQKRLRLLGPVSDKFVLVSSDILRRLYAQGLPDIGAPEGREFLDKIIEATQAEVIIIDSLSTTIRSGVENEAESWAPVQDWILQHRFRGRTVVFVHHAGKTDTQRGTSKREDMLDTIIRLKERKDMETEDECACELSFEKSREFSGAEAEALLVRVSKTAAVWRRESLKDHTQEKVRELSDQGLTQKQVAAELGLTQGHISKLLKKLAEERARRPVQEADAGGLL